MEINSELIDTLQQIYFKNIEYLQKNYPKLYENILEFEQSAQENFFIEFINGHFELVDKSKNSYYNCDPFEDARIRSENINSSPSGILMLDIKKRDIKNEDEYDFNLFINQFIDQYKNQEISNIENYKKMIFFGTLLGVHLNDIDNAVNCQSYLIVEPELEVFRLSLFLTDYEKISTKSKLFFCIGKNDIEIQKNLEEFFYNQSSLNYFFKFEIAHEKYIEQYNDISKRISNLNPSIYPYSEVLKSFINGCYNTLLLEHGVLQIDKEKNVLVDKPVLFLGSGPSLYRYKDIISENKEKFIIACAASALKRMQLEDIVPDIIITVDGNLEVIEDINVKDKYYKDSIVIASINSDQKVIEKFNKDRLFLVQNSLELVKNCGVFTGFGVGDVGVKILLQLGVKELYLCGIDAALDQIDGFTHDSTHIGNKKLELELSNSETDKLDFSKYIIKVKGNIKNEVYSTLYYKNIIDNFAQIKSDAKMYNLSHGAFLPNCIPIEAKEFNANKKSIINKQSYKKDTIIKLLNISKEVDKEYLIELHENGDILKRIILDYNRLILPYYEFILNNIPAIHKEELDLLKEKQQNIIKNSFLKALFGNMNKSPV